MAALADLQPGLVFAGDFRIVRPLAEGGMGAVYVVEQLSTGMSRALKVMQPDLLRARNPALAARNRERFFLEARIGSRIESDHVVAVLGAGVDESSGAPWIVMELLRGEDLAALLARRGALPPAEVLELLGGVCHAVGAAHRAGVLHLDLKPENIFVAEARRRGEAQVVKVLDFGIAKLMLEHQRAATVTTAIGSALWMAPEQAQRGAHVRPASDVWALGLIVFRLLTGKHYWREGNVPEAEFHVTAWLMEMMTGRLATASARALELGVVERLPANFDAWFARCVTRDPEARFHDAAAAMEAYPRSVAATQVLTAPPPPVLGPPTSWYLLVNGVQTGPFPVAALSEMARAGMIPANAQVWRPDVSSWCPIDALPDVSGSIRRPDRAAVPNTVTGHPVRLGSGARTVDAGDEIVITDSELSAADDVVITDEDGLDNDVVIEDADGVPLDQTRQPNADDHAGARRGRGR